jgi:hypothetical protein
MFFVSNLHNLNTLRTSRLILGVWLLNVADRAHNIRLLGHVMLKYSIPCSGDMQMHNLCVVYVPNVLFSSQKRDLSVFLSHSEGKMPLFVLQLQLSS